MAGKLSTSLTPSRSVAQDETHSVEVRFVVLGSCPDHRKVCHRSEDKMGRQGTLLFIVWFPVRLRSCTKVHLFTRRVLGRRVPSPL